MRPILSTLLAVIVLGALALIAQDKKPPEKMVFVTKNGNVTFQHAAHITRAKGDCKTCHDNIFPQDSKAPLNYKAGLHKTAEAAKSSCATCHNAGGPAFESKGNCAKCHVKG
jgi:c(7)-type cytochrome triheme protein